MNAKYAIAIFFSLTSVLLGESDETPDWTRVRPENTKRVFNLGPTGMQGLIHVERSRLVPGDIEPTPSTARARQILITTVDSGSPADGTIAPGDVILGIGDTPFRTDPRIALADAVNAAETEAHAGKLRLLRWRPDAPDDENKQTRPPGKTSVVALTLKVIGSYSETAPYDCPKSEAILQQTIASMLSRKGGNKLDLPYLALLATGEEEHIEAAKRYIRKIANPQIKLGMKALEKSEIYFRYYAGKSAIPYGYHPPPEYLQTNNGTSGSAALAFAMQGDRSVARFFSRLCAGGHVKLEMGHTGTFFNTMWTGLGANLAGPEVYSGFFQESTWLRTLARKWDGGFVYQSPGGGLKGYRGLDPDAAMILHYSLPRRALLITGREPDKSLWLEGEAAKAVVSVWDIDFDAKANDELLGLLGHEVPLVRCRAADTLSTRADILPSLLDALNGSRNEKIGACHALARMQAAAAPTLESLMAIVRDPAAEHWVRSRAAIAVAATGTAALPHGPELLELVASDHPGDTRRDFERELAQAALRITRQTGFDQAANKGLMHDAAAKLLGHPHQTARYYGMALIEDLPLEDFHRFAGQIQTVILNDDPAYSVYHSDYARQVGLRLLDKLNIQEGIELAIETIEPDIWGQKYRIDGEKGRLAQIRRYGANAEPYIPQLRALLGKKAGAIVEDIQTATKTRKLITMEEAIQAGKQQSP